MGDIIGGILDGTGTLLGIVHDSLTYENAIDTYTTVRSKVKLALDAAQSAKDYMAANPEAGGNLSGSKKATVMADFIDMHSNILELHTALGEEIERLKKAKNTLKLGNKLLDVAIDGASKKVIGGIKNVANNGGAMADSLNDMYDDFAAGDYVGGVKNLIHTGGQLTDLLTRSDGYDAALDTYHRQEALEDTYSQRYKDGEIGFFEMLFGYTGATSGNFLGIVDAGVNWASPTFPSNETLDMFGIDPLDIPDSWVNNTSNFMGHVGEEIGATLDYGINRIKLTISNWLD